VVLPVLLLLVRLLVLVRGRGAAHQTCLRTPHQTQTHQIHLHNCRHL
jgi:hypothetical protein